MIGAFSHHTSVRIINKYPLSRAGRRAGRQRMEYEFTSESMLLCKASRGGGGGGAYIYTSQGVIRTVPFQSSPPPGAVSGLVLSPGVHRVHLPTEMRGIGLMRDKSADMYQD